MAKGGLFRLIDGYESRSITGKSFASFSYSGEVTRRRQRIKKMRFFGFIDGVARGISATSCQVYGSAALTYGVLTVLVHFLKDYFTPDVSLPLASLIVGIAFSILAIPLLLADKPIADLLRDVSVIDYILYEFFCIRRTYTDGGERTIPFAPAIIFSALLALLGYFIPAWVIAAAVGAFLFLYGAILSPEFAFFSSLLVLPYLNFLPEAELIFSAMVLISGASFFRKSTSGKRVIFLEQYDLLLGMMLLFVIASGIFMKGIESFTSALLMLVMSVGYFLASNIVTNRRLADCTLKAMVFSSILPVLVAIGQFAYFAMSEGLLETLKRGVSSTFASPDVFSVFLVVAVICTAALASQNHKSHKFFYVLMLVMQLASLVMTGEVIAVLAIILSAVAYRLVKRNATAVLLLPILFLIPYSVLFIPESVRDVILDYADIEALWRTAATALKENPILGIGIGDGSFATEMAERGIFWVSDAHNLFLGFGVTAGVCAFGILVLMILVRLRHRLVYRAYVKHSQVGRIAPMMSVAVFALLCLGATEYIWADFSMFYLFWCVFGIGSATLRVAKKEHDDRVLYFEDTRRTYSSALNVHVR